MKRIIFFLLFAACFNLFAGSADSLVIQEKTEILLKLLTPLKSGKTQVGEVVEFLVEKPVKTKEGTLLVEDAASAYGTVTLSQKSGFFGTPGKLDFKIDYVEAFNDVQIPVRASLSQTAAGSEGAAIAGFLFVSILSGFFRGDNVSIPSGTIFKAYVDKDTVLIEEKQTISEVTMNPEELNQTDLRILEMYKKIK